MGSLTTGERVVGAVALVACVVGVALMLGGSGVALRTVGVALEAFGGVALALLAFYVIGESEDRDGHQGDDQPRRPSGTPTP